MASEDTYTPSDSSNAMMGTTALDHDHSLDKPVKARVIDRPSSAASSEEVTDTAHRINNLDAEIGELADPGKEQPRFDSAGQRWPRPRGWSKSM
jgi:hypothetical protein